MSPKRVTRSSIQKHQWPFDFRAIYCTTLPDMKDMKTMQADSFGSYGVSRVFSQQSVYLLSDAQMAQSNMRALLKAVRTSELHPNAGKAR